MKSTISARLEACNHRPSGFDYMRLLLASLVVWTHTTNVVLGSPAVENFWHSPARPFLAAILGMFFCLSGFLVAGSLARCRTMISFLGLRVIRLVPALAVDTLVAALIIGPLFTVLPLGAYFSSETFWSYFLNIVGEVHFYLPGVFESHPRTEVNAQLWTLPYELICYFLLTAAAVVGLVRYRHLFLAVTCALILFYFARIFVLNESPNPMTLDGRSLVMSFLLGVTTYLYRDKVVLAVPYLVISVIAAYVLLSLRRYDYIAIFPIAYITVFLGLLTPRRSIIVTSGDYSYGIFLYGFPIQQVVYALFGANPWINLLVSYPIIVGIAMLSWFLVEKPALKLRPLLVAFEKRVVDLAHALPFGHWMVQPPVGPWLRRPPARENV